MSDPVNNEAEALQQQLDRACRAQVPSLAEVRQYRQRIFELLVAEVCELMAPGCDDKSLPFEPSVTLEVISVASPRLSAPRGFCSPLKSADLRRFENLVRGVFGNDTEPCSTGWRV